MRAIAVLLPVSFTTLVCTSCAWVAISGLTPSAPDQSSDIAAAAMLPTAPPIATGRGANPSGRWQRAGDGLFYVTAMVNQVEVRFLVDTGASVTVLTKEDALRVGARPTGAATTIATVGGAAPMRWTALKHVDLAGQRVEQVSAAVVDRPGGVSLLGQNMLRQMKTFSIKGDELTIS